MEKILMLLIEDDRNDILLIKHALKKAQINILMEIYEDGETAISNLRELAENRLRAAAVRPAFILLDLKIPRISGFEVLRWIRSHPDMWSIPVIVFSSSNQSTDIQQAYQLGANSYLVKPVEFEALSRIIALLVQYWGRMNEMVPS